MSPVQPKMFVCHSKLTELLAELTEFAAELSEFSPLDSALETVFRPFPIEVEVALRI